MNFKSFKRIEEELIKCFINDNISSQQAFDESKISREKKGLYFICENNTLLYIGCAKDRSLYKRCKQYFNSGDSGATFIHSYMEYKYKIKVKKYKSKIINDDDVKKAINSAKKNCKFRFIELSMNTNPNDILALESSCISIYKPILNK